MKGFVNGLSALFGIAIAPVVILSLPLLFLVGAGVGLYKNTVSVSAKKTASVVWCTIDTDCSSGHVCVDGRCVPVRI